MSTSIAYLRGRLERAGRRDLLAAVDSGELSHYAAAEAANIIKRRPTAGGGSENEKNRRFWAVLRATGKAPALKPRLKPELPTQPQFSKETRDIVVGLVADGRSDLVLAIMERKISPFQASL